MMLNLLLVDDMKTERISENEALGKANDVGGHSPRPQQDENLPKECTKGGTDTQVCVTQACGWGHGALLEMSFR